jgi:hypothetical protein
VEARVRYRPHRRQDMAGRHRLEEARVRYRRHPGVPANLRERRTLLPGLLPARAGRPRRRREVLRSCVTRRRR